MKAIIALGFGLLVSGCVTPERQAQIDAGIAMSFAVSCSLVDVGWAGWKVYESKHKISDNSKARVAGAYAAAAEICSTPPVNTPEFISAAVRAANAFDQAVKDAKNG